MSGRSKETGRSKWKTQRTGLAADCWGRQVLAVQEVQTSGTDTVLGGCYSATRAVKSVRMCDGASAGTR